MKTFALGTILADQTPGIGPATASGMRALLRDTALFVSNFATGDATSTYEAMRRDCEDLIERFGAALARESYPDDVRDDALTAQCALLDEIALRRLSEQDRMKWASLPLQVEKFEQHDAGERVFERLDMRMRERTPQVDLLACYAAILGLGFKGRYLIGAQDKLEALITELNGMLASLRSRDAQPLLTEHGGRSWVDRVRRLSPWAIAGIGGVVALVIWMLWHVALDARLATLVSTVVKP